MRAGLPNAAAPLPLLVLAASCLLSASALAQQGPISNRASGAGRGDEGGSVRRGPTPNTVLSEVMAGTARTTAAWLARLRQAAREPAYSGTYVVWSAPGALASSHIWRASRDGVRVERVDALSGEPRSTYRVTDRTGSSVETFLSAQRVLRIDRSDMPGGGGFPNLPDAGQGVSPANYYDARQGGQERVAGFMADVVQFVPRDGLRYGYRVWSEQRTGLAIRLQTLDEQGRVLEQAAFSGLTLDAPVNAAALLREKPRADGWQVERVARVPTTAVAEGWRIGGPTKYPAPGFAPQRCYRQQVPVRAVDAQAGNTLANSSARNRVIQSGWFQCVFSDGLAAVSVFIEPYDAARHKEHQAGELEATLGGATHLLARRVDAAGWVTVVGEVPPQTLQRFVTGIARLPQEPVHSLK